MRWVNPARLKVDPDLAGVFPIRDQDRTAIAESMRAHQYDQAEPIVVWSTEHVVVDGHTRLAAAVSAGLEQVYIDERPFEDKHDALTYAIRRQRDRRNLTGAELAGFITRSIEALDRVKPRGGDRKSDEARSIASAEAIDPVRSSKETAEKVGASHATVERVRAVMASGDEETKTKLRSGQVTVNGAYTAVKTADQARLDSAPPLVLSVQTVLDKSVPEPELKSFYTAADWQMLTVEERAIIAELAPLTEEGRKAGFNPTNENIDWAKWSWNPVTGCLHNCDYCYARDIAERFFTQAFVPTFLPSRLHAPRRTRVPAAWHADDPSTIGWKNVFVCSMADLFGKWVPQDWIDAVFAEILSNPQWNFLCLTKFPQRLAELDWPSNVWCGTTVDRQHRVEIAERSFRGVTAGIKWLSCEPLMERLTFSSLEMFDWIVIGAASKSTQTPEFQPPWEWVEHLLNQARAAGCQVYIKPNLKSRPQEYPGMP